MKSTGRLKEISGKIMTIEVDHPDGAEGLLALPLLDISITRHVQKRSRNANALLWACLGDIASALRADKWDIYLKMLRRYGQYTYICVRPQAVEMIKRQWRECEEIGQIDIHGERAIQILCYYGSSTYNSREFSVLLDGVISEMKEMGLHTPMPEEVKQSLEEWEKTMAAV